MVGGEKKIKSVNFNILLNCSPTFPTLISILDKFDFHINTVTILQNACSIIINDNKSETSNNMNNFMKFRWKNTRLAHFILFHCQ